MYEVASSVVSGILAAKFLATLVKKIIKMFSYISTVINFSITYYKFSSHRLVLTFFYNFVYNRPHLFQVTFLFRQ